MKILIATTNPGKFNEFAAEFRDLRIDFISLKDLKLDKIEVDEPYDELWRNAWHKAKFFAKKSKLITIAEDTGFFVEHLGGEPGILAKRYASTGTQRIQKVLTKLKGVPAKGRGAHFLTSACVYDPGHDSFSIFSGRADGLIANKVSRDQERPGMDYDAIFYYPPLKKIFSELSVLEKNQVSHRGRVISQIKVYLARQCSFKQFFVPTALIVRDQKLLLTKRRDSRAEFNNKWEFPGGAVESGEGVEDALRREIKEETGFEVEPIELLPRIMTKVEKKYSYQVFLAVYVCKIVGGKISIADHETMDYGWFTIREAIKLDSLPLNKKCIQTNIKLLKKYVRY